MTTVGRPRTGQPPAWPVTYRVPRPTAALGSCESAPCPRAARVVCAGCRGEFCLRHQDHPGHRDPSDGGALRASLGRAVDAG